jgi:hypothetical protein
MDVKNINVNLDTNLGGDCILNGELTNNLGKMVMIPNYLVINN